MRGNMGIILEGLNGRREEKVHESIKGYDTLKFFRNSPVGLKFKIGNDVLIFLDSKYAMDKANYNLAMNKGLIDGSGKLVLPKGSVGTFRGGTDFEFDGVLLNGLDDQIMDFNLTVVE